MLGAVLSGRLAEHLSAQRPIRLGCTFMFTGALAQSARRHTQSSERPIACPAAVRIYDGDRHRHAEPHAAAARSLSGGARSRVIARGFAQFAFSRFNAGTIARFLARSLILLALGMATLTVANLGLWLPYRSRKAIHPQSRPN